MAKTKLTWLVLLAISICLEAKSLKIKKSNMVFYMQDWASGPNITAIPIAGISNKPWLVQRFGTVVCVDDALTDGYDRNTTQVGRAHGIYLTSALDGSDLHLLMSIVFTNKKFNGSTLEIQGADRILLKYREVSVVSGTGKFRFARGYAILETVYVDVPTGNGVIRWNVTVLY